MSRFLGSLFGKKDQDASRKHPAADSGASHRGLLGVSLKQGHHGFTVKPVLRDHCHERPPVLKDNIIPAEGPTFQCN